MELPSIIESILFAHGEPIATARLAELCEVGEDEVRNALQTLKELYTSRGFMILEHQGSIELVTRPEAAPFITKLMKIDPREPLTRAALETLAIVAYEGPLSRARIEHVRGVNSSFIVRNLLVRGLIEKTVDPNDKRTNLYQITFEFLKYMGIENAQSLPDYATLTEALRAEAKSEKLEARE